MRHLEGYARQASRHVGNFARQGAIAWHTARHYGRIVDRYVNSAADLYGSAIQPGLRKAGVDTSNLDKTLLKSYDYYSQTKKALGEGAQMADHIAGHMRHY